MKDNPLKIIENEQQFEELCCIIAQHKFGDFDAQKYGRRGQKQWGVDIRATNKRMKGEKIVIQCKYKANPPKSKIKAIQKEINNELNQAIEGASFDCFIYASNIPRDNNLQKFAASLCTDDYSVIVWSQDDIVDDIYRYERLKQIYTLDGIKHGVEIINTDFIETLLLDEEISNPNIFRFYISSNLKNTQWYGIVKNWDVIRKDHENFIKSIEESFSNLIIESKIAGLIIGEGGSGKSVFLRRIAIDISKNQKDLVVWWVEDLETFIVRDINPIEDNPQYKHLIIVEDWYRTVGDDKTYSNILFNWLKKKNNVRLVIGDRLINKAYQNQITERNKFQISLGENIDILESIKLKLPVLQNNIDRLLVNQEVINRSPIFVILYILSELSKNEDEVNYDEMHFGNVFKELIGKKINSFEEDARYKGLGMGLYVSATLYSELNYFAISENAFLIMSEFLGKNRELINRLKLNKVYPKQFHSLANIEELTFRSGLHLKRLGFNHDLIAEKGISLIQETKYSLDFILDAYEAENLINLFLDHNEFNAALTILLWLKDNVDNLPCSMFFQKFDGKLENVSSAGQVKYFESLSKQQRALFAKEILEQKDFFKLPSQIVSHSLRIWQNDELGKNKAKEILEQRDFFKLPYQIVSHSLRIWQNDELGKNKAKEILKQRDFFKLPYQIVSHSLRIWQNDELGINKAKEIINLLLSDKHIGTFLVFSSLKIYCNSKLNFNVDIIQKVYEKIKAKRKKRNFGRLYFDLLYLPLFHIKIHFLRISSVINSYSYDCTISQKRSLSNVLNCFREYPNEYRAYFDIEDLIKNINTNWFEDLEYQKVISPTEIIDKHIALSILNIHSKLKAYSIAKEIVKYCSDSTLLKQQILFKTATAILEKEDFEFWK